jgi:hypothetical protein
MTAKIIKLHQHTKQEELQIMALNTSEASRSMQDAFMRGPLECSTNEEFMNAAVALRTSHILLAKAMEQYAHKNPVVQVTIMNWKSRHDTV